MRESKVCDRKFSINRASGATLPLRLFPTGFHSYLKVNVAVSAETATTQRKKGLWNVAVLLGGSYVQQQKALRKKRMECQLYSSCS